MEEYIVPQIEIIKFDTEDIITTSTNSNGIIELPFIPIQDIK